jgi:hypothetical protein
MACTVSNHIVSKEEVAGRREPEIGAACECGRFVYLGNGFWQMMVTGRCPVCSHVWDDHGLCCGCTLRIG